MADFEVDREKRQERIKWLRLNGDRDVVLEELVLFSRRMDVLALQLMAQQKLAEASYMRSMTAGRRQCQRCVACRKYIPGGCLACGCPPLLHDKVSYTQNAQECEQCDEQLGNRKPKQAAASLAQRRPRGQTVRFAVESESTKADPPLSPDPTPNLSDGDSGGLNSLADGDLRSRATQPLRKLSHLLKLTLSGSTKRSSSQANGITQSEPST
eukprot:GGOE01018295.1.p1 GENE.GGOE01018295.1~~GGOE01018295.1.p1  ORF type:complete len:234 (-),score=51.09 GGOE01018295.1:327-962(-)